VFEIQNRAGKFVAPAPGPIHATANLVTSAKATSTGLVINVVDPPKPSLPHFSAIKTKDARKKAAILEKRQKLLAQAKAKNKKLVIAYPICTFTYVIVPTAAKQATDLKQFLTWALNKGQSYGAAFYFVPIPAAVQKASLKLVGQIHKAS
jgi:ABC-type phosphate transport system substrate-binding protein